MYYFLSQEQLFAKKAEDESRETRHREDIALMYL